MRAYFFGNMYLSSIQQGIQAAHVVTEMFMKYEPDEDDGQYLYNWADHHKTMVLLNGGYSESIADLALSFNDTRNPYPWTIFHEEQASLAGALTCAGIILPQKIYDMARVLRQVGQNDPIYEEFAEGTVTQYADNDYGIDTDGAEEIVWTFNRWEFSTVQQLNTFSLAH